MYWFSFYPSPLGRWCPGIVFPAGSCPGVDPFGFPLGPGCWPPFAPPPSFVWCGGLVVAPLPRLGPLSGRVFLLSPWSARLPCPTRFDLSWRSLSRQGVRQKGPVLPSLIHKRYIADVCVIDYRLPLSLSLLFLCCFVLLLIIVSRSLPCCGYSIIAAVVVCVCACACACLRALNIDISLVCMIHDLSLSSVVQNATDCHRRVVAQGTNA